MEYVSIFRRNHAVRLDACRVAVTNFGWHRGRRKAKAGLAANFRTTIKFISHCNIVSILGFQVINISTFLLSSSRNSCVELLNEKSTDIKIVIKLFLEIRVIMSKKADHPFQETKITYLLSSLFTVTCYQL